MPLKHSDMNILLKESYESGLSVRELSFVYEIPMTTVYKRLTKVGARMRSVGRRPQKENNDGV